MNERMRKHIVLPLLGLGLAIAMTGTAHAQSDVSASLQVNLGESRHWSQVRGTQVRELRQDERPGYDMFRYGGRYYAYNNNQWYSSRHGSGSYGRIDERTVPSEISRVPQDHWREYPSSWPARNDRHRRTSQRSY